MQNTLKGPLPVFAVYLLLLAAAYAGGDGGVDHAASGSVDLAPWPVARCVSAALGGPDGSTGTGAVMATVLLAFAAAVTTWFVVLLSWTGNRVVSFIAGALWCLVPVFGESFLTRDGALIQVLPTLGIGLTLLIRERGWAAVHRGHGARSWEAAALVIGLLTMASGPSGLAVGVLAVLVDLVFHHGHGGPRPQRDALANALPIATLVWSGALWAFSPTGTGGLAAFDGWFPNVFAVVLVFVACGGLVMGLRHMTAGPKWVVLYAGFGAAWYVACAAAATAGNASGGLAAAAGLTLLPPAILWRYLLALVPELPTSGSAAPTLVPEKLRANLPPFPDLPDVAPVATTPASQIGRPSSAIPFPSVPEVRASVEAAVQTAVAAATNVVRSAAVAPDGASPAVVDVQRVKRASEALNREWNDRALDRNLFANYCRPYLSTRTRVLEIGQGNGAFTRLMAPEVEHVVCFDFSRSRLDAARQALSDNVNVSYVLGDESGLAPLRAGSIDLAFSYELFVHLDQEEAFLYLQDLRRVLRPGGRAILAFANLLDPLGFAQFEAEVAGRRPGGRTVGRINFLSPDVVRTLVTSAQLDVESIHLAANNRDMITILGRPSG